LGNIFKITGLVDSKEASNLSLLLRAVHCQQLSIRWKTHGGPYFGPRNISAGHYFIGSGYGHDLSADLVYYRFFGLVRKYCLVLNLILLCALLSHYCATLQLPGIAGIVLTVAWLLMPMCSSMNAIREGLRHGLSPQTAIYAGYDRAFATILDAEHYNNDCGNCIIFCRYRPGRIQ